MAADVSSKCAPKTFCNTQQSALQAGMLWQMHYVLAMSDWGGTCRRQRVMRTPLEVIMDVEAELAMHGYADPSTSLFRGCNICLLPLPKLQSTDSAGAASSDTAQQRLFQSTQDIAKAAAETEQALLECQARRLSLQACLGCDFL